MKISLQTIFYILAIIALLLTIIQIIDNMMDNDDEDEQPDTQYVIMPWVTNYRPYWRRFRRNIPWVGPRPGNGWVGRFGRRHHRRGGRRHRR